MTKSIKFFLTTSWIIITRTYDAYSTNQFTSDLSKEANPLVSVLGMGWTPLLITVVLLTIYSIYAYAISVFKPIDLLPSERGYTFSNFVAYTYLGHKDNWMAVFYKLPKDFNHFNQYMGQLLTKCLVYAGFVSTCMWLLINYTDFYIKLHSAAFIYSILLIGCFVIIYNWNRKSFERYLKNKLIQ